MLPCSTRARAGTHTLRQTPPAWPRLQAAHVSSLVTKPSQIAEQAAWGSRAADISLAARPSFLCERATDKDVM